MDLHPHILSHAITSNFLLKSHDHCSYLVGVGSFLISELITSHWGSALASSSFSCTKHIKQFSNYHSNTMSMSLKQKVVFLMSKKITSTFIRALFFFLPGRNGEFVGSCVGNCVLSGLICSNSGGRSLGGSAVCRGTSTGGRTKNKTTKQIHYA